MNDTAERGEATADETQRNAQGAAIPVGRPVISVAHDADEQARNLVGWRQTYDQLAAGRFVGTLTELPLDTMKVFRESTSHTLRQACEVRGDAYWFGIPVAREGGVRIDSQPVGAGAFALRPGNVEFELLTPAQFSIYGVVVRGDVLRRYAASVERTSIQESLPGASVVEAGAARIERLRALLASRLDEDHARAPASNAPLSDFERNEMQAEVLAALFEVLTGSGEPVVESSSRRRWIVAQARDYVLAHRTRPVGVPELCEQLHVSRRTLQYCFHDVLGMAPATYLRALRLNGARRDLCGRAAGSVQDVAAAWGFWHLSQFATDYRRMFGMRPSEALRAAGNR
ncbi:helix-turn-helix domain-containing protein [Paraburkholderia lycopersici]|uniref:AraC family transcriptional regulator, ethanolamine operon transcriptional activator n=1 Tax=Paraburkholderia lycopersici TaxID=416944 RepID=A0A1G6MCE5_9BURK|nr:helix-turn-helix domain-containing protein [Paraburkholderia lycopersici]SDC53183.1 AraC family transcriptional regulator, ethanolamine operon transcriptional activator [Paraburkholderia lycopersici]